MINSKNKKKGVSMPPILTILIVLIIFLILGVTRIIVREAQPENMNNDDHMTSVDYSNHFILKNHIINMLANREDTTDSNQMKNEGTYHIYIKYLMNQLSYSTYELNRVEYTQLKDKINELLKIMNIENENDFTRMSLDGRAVSIDLAKDIYQLCGLRLITNIDGEIKLISDQAGNTIYNNQKVLLNQNFQIKLLLIVLLTLLFLLVLIIIVIKKNNIYKKDEYDDEINEKRYA